MNVNLHRCLAGALLLVVLGLGLGCADRLGVPVARLGVLELAGYDLEGPEPVRLDGEWAFYGGQFLTPEDFLGKSEPRPTAYLQLPSAWNGVQPAMGYATLRLKILSVAGHSPQALRLFGLNSAYRLWVNGRLAAESGRIGRRADEESPDPSVRLVPIRSEGNPIELLLQVSNFHFRDGGVLVSIQLGREAALQAGQNRNWGLALFFIGSLLVMGVYHLALYAFRKADKAPLYFGIYCLLWLGNILGTDSSDWVLRLFLPGLSAEFLYQMSQLCFFLSVPVGYRFFRSLYPQEFSSRLLHGSQVLAAVFGLLALGAPTLLVSRVLPVYYAISIALILVSLFGLYQAWRQGREGAAFILAGFLFLGLVAINDMLNDLQVFHTGYVINIGMFVFVLAQAVALSLRFSRAFSAIEALTAELVHKNVTLEEEMTERLRLEREIVQVSEDERRRVSHELHDGLCQQLTAARLRCSVLERKWPKENGGVLELAQLSALLEASVDQAYDLSHGLWPVEHDPNDVCTSLAGLVRRAAAASGIAMDFQQQRPCETCTNAHVTQLHHIAQEAIANAVKHACPGRILVSLDCLSRHTVTLTVQDDGLGRKAAKKTKGGLGLRIMTHRARMLGGDFRIEDGEDRGTIVTCSVPCEGYRFRMGEAEA